MSEEITEDGTVAEEVKPVEEPVAEEVTEPAADETVAEETL